MHVSPTQIDKYRRCPRLIGWEYVEQVTPPPSPKMQFGLDVHKTLENWLREGIAPDDSAPGQVAAQGLHWLPAPSRKFMEVETRFQIPLGDNLLLTGIIDCLVEPGGTSDGIPLVIDHKSTSDLKWAKTADDLHTDLQSMIYATFAALRFSLPQVRCRWVYYAASNPKNKPRKPTGAKPVEIVHDVSSSWFLDKWDLVCRDVDKIVSIRRKGRKALTLPPNPSECTAWGGCYFAEYCALTPEDTLAAAIKQEERK